MAGPLSQNDATEFDELWRIRQMAEQEAREQEDRRAFERKNVFWKARLVLPEGAINCVVYDLSMGGARVRLVAQLQKQQRLRLDIEKLSPLNAEVVWLGIGMVGIRFTDDPAFIGRTLGPLLAGGTPQGAP
ncbi:MAG: PilZ domain-containing protein [Alphaproteobacteria bacterium]|nr:PilZ domain-containing protein [Alphaproteobacteria bacterium]